MEIISVFGYNVRLSGQIDQSCNLANQKSNQKCYQLVELHESLVSKLSVLARSLSVTLPVVTDKKKSMEIFRFRYSKIPLSVLVQGYKIISHRCE